MHYWAIIPHLTEVLFFTFHIGNNRNIVSQVTGEGNAVCEIRNILGVQATEPIITEHREREEH
jgi:hypothetical protein